MESPLSHLPLIVRRRHPQLKSHIDYLLRTGAVVSVLPGVLRWAHEELDYPLRASAAAVWRPQGVLLSGAAALLTWWPEHPESPIELATRPSPSAPAWLECREYRIPPQLTIRLGDARLAGPELAILGILGHGDPTGVFEGLRRRVTTLARLQEALEILPKARGNPTRRHLLEICRDNPWSPLELDAHKRLREAGITGWRANHRIEVGRKSCYLDIAFEAEHLALELDGWEFHKTQTAFITDRERQNRLTLAGWTVLRFTAATMDALVPETRRLLFRNSSPSRRIFGLMSRRKAG